jgi:hypothetical protein
MGWLMSNAPSTAKSTMPPAPVVMPLVAPTVPTLRLPFEVNERPLPDPLRLAATAPMALPVSLRAKVPAPVISTPDAVMGPPNCVTPVPPAPVANRMLPAPAFMAPFSVISAAL